MTVRANTTRSEDARTAHVLPGSSHARADEWVNPDVFPMGDAEFRAWLDYECQALAQVESPDPWAEAVSAELVACTLGQRSRPELRVDRVGRFAHLVSQGTLHLKASARALMDELAAYRYPVRPEGIEPPTTPV